jgi:hypothetical protein
VRLVATDATGPCSPGRGDRRLEPISQMGIVARTTPIEALSTIVSRA